MPKKEPGKRDAYLQSILNNLQDKCAKLPYDISVHELKSKDANAFAFPGYSILALSGLLDKAESENEIAFVLAHELGHFKHRHHLRKLGRSLVFMTMSVAFMGSNSRITNAFASSLDITEMKFSQSEETQSDIYALGLVNCLYGHVGGSTHFFERIDKIEKSKYRDYLFSTHPIAKQRVKKLSEYSKKKGYEIKELIPKPDDF